MPSEENKVTSEYGKMPVWQWIVIYLLVGGIIYGLFYSFLMYRNIKRTDGPYSKNQVSQPTDQIQEPEVVVNEDQNMAEIELTDEGFSPDIVSVTVGTTVTWTNNSSAKATVNSSMHPTHEDYLPLNLGAFEPEEKLSLLFDTVGIYKYHNHLNPTQFGTIEVIKVSGVSQPTENQ